MTLEELLVRAWHGVVAGTAGPLRFRFVLQPLVATVIALRAGVRDARDGRRPFVSALLTDKGQRHEHLSRGWSDVARLFALAMGVDLALQLVVRRQVVPLEAVLVAILLAFVPYLLLCGPMNRLARRYRHVHMNARPEP